MKKIFVLLVCFFICSQVFSQHLIGLNKDEIKAEMKKHYPSFSIDNSVINNTYKYLKYVNKFSEQTMLVFLSDDNKCTATKLISDYSNLIDIKNKLNKTYKAAGKDKWTYKVNGITYQITLTRSDYFFSVFTGKK